MKTETQQLTIEVMLENQTLTFWDKRRQIYTVKKQDAIEIAKEYAQQFAPKWVSVETPPEVGKEVIVEDLGQNDIATFKTSGVWRSCVTGEQLFNVKRWMEIPL